MPKIKLAKKGIVAWGKAKKIIPGGNQFLSKRAELFLPNQWPSYYKKAKGIKIWDLDNNEYLDMSTMGTGSCLLGYADPDINRAVEKAIKNGSMSSLNCPEEIELAELLCKLHPWASKVRYARGGGEAMTIAVRIGRAYSKKDKVAFCGYHGWSDWYLAANLADDKNLDGHLLSGLNPAGVPRGLIGTALPFNYNRIDELEKIIADNEIGVIVVETLRHDEPKNNFLENVRKIADKIGAVLIFDEITIGFRLAVGGAHLKYNVNPDIAVFAKGMSNGFPMAAVIGKNNIMEAAQDTFITSTYWSEGIGPVAALATIRKIIKNKVPLYLEKIGRQIENGWSTLAQKHHLKIKISTPYQLISFNFDYNEKNQAIKTLFTQEMLKRGFLAMTSVYVSYAHKPEHVKKYLKEVDEVFGIINKAIREEKIEKLLRGPIAQSGFQRLIN